MTELWIKIAWIGSDHLIGTLQCRITEESFGPRPMLDTIDMIVSLPDRLNEAIESGKMFKVFDPIKLQLTPEGIGAAVLVGPKAMPLPTASDSLNVNPKAIAWWAPLEVTSDWERIVAGTIHGIELAGDMPPPPPASKGPRLVRP